jgi:hypothetical protein
MMRAAWATMAASAIVMSGFTACGGNMRPPDPLPTPDAGEWAGQFSFAMAGSAPRKYDGSITLAQNVSDSRSVDVSGLCPDGSGTVIASGFNGSYQWTGGFQCHNPTFVNICPVTLRYTSVRVDVVGDSMTLHAEGKALSAACEMDVATTLNFVCEDRTKSVH